LSQRRPYWLYVYTSRRLQATVSAAITSTANLRNRQDTEVARAVPEGGRTHVVQKDTRRSEDVHRKFSTRSGLRAAACSIVSIETRPCEQAHLPRRSADLYHLKPGNLSGAIVLGGTVAVTAAGGWLSRHDAVVPWAVGQIVLSVALVEWFVLLHECGHDTLFREHALHRPVGYVAGFSALIPFECWRRIQVQELSRRSLRLETELKAPQDIEWATTTA
jgi:hypothetical protein